MGIFVYLRASRLPFLTGSLFPVVVATALAYVTDHTWNFLFFGLTMLGVAALQVGANLINDYYDSFGSDPLNRNFTPFSGGSRVIQDGQMSPGQVKILAYLMLGLGAACGLGLIYLGRPWVALVGLLGLGAALFYSARPLQLMSGGLGEIIIFLAFGPLLTWGAYYVQTGKFSLVGAAVSLPLAFLITAIIWINEFPDMEADLAACATTWWPAWGGKAPAGPTPP
jgi:1,4-dihydroxy-2-naphthoate octaprenyltransferase